MPRGVGHHGLSYEAHKSDGKMSVKGLEAQKMMMLMMGTTMSFDSTSQEKSEPVAQKKGVPLGQYMQYVKGEFDRENSCLQLPQTIVLLVSFSLLAMLHLKQDKVFAIEGALRFDIEENANFAWSHNFGHKTVFDVNSIPDFWSWVQIGFLPLVVQHAWGWSEDLQGAYNWLNSTHPFNINNLPTHFGWPKGPSGQTYPGVQIPVRDDLLHYNRIIGGIRMRQERSERSYDHCRFPGSVPENLWKNWLGKPCMPANPTYEQSPEAGEAEDFGKQRRVEWLATVRDNLDHLQQTVIDMEDGCSQLAAKNRTGACLCISCTEDSPGSPVPWLDEQTQRVELGFISYNAEYGLLSLTTVTFFFTRGGMIHKFVHVQSSWADHFAGEVFDVFTMIVCDVTWAGLLLYVFVNESIEIYRILRTSKERCWRALYDDYLDKWNIVDWVSMGLAAFCVQMFIQILFETWRTVDEFEKIVGTDLAAMSRADYSKRMDDFITMMEGLCNVERWYRVSFCFYPMAVMMRLFKSFAAQGRLAVVTRTLSGASTDMIHFFIVFFSVFFCMVVNSVLIFGQDIEDYADMVRATMTCFRNMFGDWDWGAMKEGSLWMSAMWFWIFVIVIMVILLGFLLAILMDSFAVEKEKSMDEESLMKQIDKMMRRRSENKAKERVKLVSIYESFLAEYDNDEKKLMAEETYITPEDAMLHVENLPRTQAERTIRNAKEMFADPAPEYTMENVKKDLDVLDKKSRTIKDTMTNARETIYKYDTTVDFSHKTVHHELEKSVPPRTQIVDTVREEIGLLGRDVTKVVENEVEVFAEQHRELETQNRNMLACMTDTHRVMKAIREQTEQTRMAIQRQALLEQRRKQAMQRALEAKKESAGALGACMSSAPAPPTRVMATTPR